MTFGLGQKIFRDFCVNCGFHAAWCFTMDPCSMGKLRFSFSSVAQGRRCSACSTCNEVVPACKEFFPRETDPRTSESAAYSVLVCTVYQVQGMLHLERGYTRLEYIRVQYSYDTAAVRILVSPPHISITILNFGGGACRISFASINSANTPKTWWGGNLLFLAEGKHISRNVFSQTVYCSKNISAEDTLVPPRWAKRGGNVFFFFFNWFTRLHAAEPVLSH